MGCERCVGVTQLGVFAMLLAVLVFLFLRVSSPLVGLVTGDWKPRLLMFNSVLRQWIRIWDDRRRRIKVDDSVNGLHLQISEYLIHLLLLGRGVLQRNAQPCLTHHAVAIQRDQHCKWKYKLPMRTIILLSDKWNFSGCKTWGSAGHCRTNNGWLQRCFLTVVIFVHSEATKVFSMPKTSLSLTRQASVPTSTSDPLSLHPLWIELGQFSCPATNTSTSMAQRAKRHVNCGGALAFVNAGFLWGVPTKRFFFGVRSCFCGGEAIYDWHSNENHHSNSQKLNDIDNQHGDNTLVLTFLIKRHGISGSHHYRLYLYLSSLQIGWLQGFGLEKNWCKHPWS